MFPGSRLAQLCGGLEKVASIAGFNQLHQLASSAVPLRDIASNRSYEVCSRSWPNHPMEDPRTRDGVSHVVRLHLSIDIVELAAPHTVGPAKAQLECIVEYQITVL